jgi:hypothetical protein
MEVSVEPNKSRKPEAPAKRGPRKEWRIKKVIRLLAFCTGVCLVGAGLAARSAYGDVTASALALGHELGKMGDVGEKRPVRLNGQPIYVTSTTESTPLSEVLDRMEAICRENSVGLVKELDDLTEELKKELPSGPDSAEAAGIVRKEEATSGFVACFARDANEREKATDVAARLVEVIETGELSKLGKLRYLFGERTKEGRTHIVAVWTDGPFNLYSLFPQFEGDAPGADPKDVPRPIDSSRLLTADIEGVPYGIHMYESAARYTDVLANYDEELPKRGWEAVLTDPGGEAEERVYQRGGVDLMIFAGRGASDDRTIVSLVQMRGR